MPNKWQLRSKESFSKSFLGLCLGDSLVARLLVNRGVHNEELLQYYVSTENVKFSSPFEIPEMDKAFHRVKTAIAKNEKILIYGDYDVDGTSSVALLYRAFAMIDVAVSFYVPSRLHEGYGLNNAAIKKIREEMKVDLMITCDCGISNYNEVEYAHSLGLDVIVTDHHSIPLNPPPSIANCNPKTLAEAHPLHYLPGVGVAFKLAEALISEYCADLDIRASRINSLLDLVAVGIVADLAPLKSENRVLCIRGLEVLSRTKKPGLQKLLNISGSNDNANTEHIGFGIAPRINAAGRLSDAMAAVRLMITDDYAEAEELCDFLDSENTSRQELCDKIQESALSKLAEELDLKLEKSIVIGDASWHHGVIGIVASRLVEKFHLPVFIMSIEEHICKGSVRGIDIGDLDIFAEMQAIQANENIFLKYGGHKLAAGFSIAKEDFQRFLDICKTHFRKRLAGCDVTKVMKVDSALFLEENNEKLLSRIELLSPFGIDHPQPVFVSGPLKIKSYKLMGKERKHLKLFLSPINTKYETSKPIRQGGTAAERASSRLRRTNDRSVLRVHEDHEDDENAGIGVRQQCQAVLWNRAEEFLLDLPRLENNLYIAYTPKINDFMNEKAIQLEIKDWKAAECVEPEVVERVSPLSLSPSVQLRG
jgi:single-stranded-DNA-specific exonuclease